MGSKYHFKSRQKNNFINFRKSLSITAFGLLLLSAATFGFDHTPNSKIPKKIISVNYSNPTIQILTPKYDSFVAGQAMLTADLTNTPNSNYDMFWYVDNGSWNWMGNTGATDKQASIDFNSWTWHKPSNLYTITLVAVMHGNGQRIYSGVQVHVGSPSTSQTQASGSSTTITTTNTSIPVNTSSSTALSLYVDPSSNGAKTAASTTDPTAKRVLTKLAAQPTAFWFGDWSGDIQASVASVVNAAAAKNQAPVLVAYNIPDRDCNGYSAGGATSASAYKDWIKSFAAGISNHHAIVILEPDALANITCLSSTGQTERYQLLNFAVDALRAGAGTEVYLDAGNPSWIPASQMADRLKAAGVASANGFSLNVSNFIDTPTNIGYGKQISALTANKHFVIDTSRNGNGSNGQWCNPRGRALGPAPTSDTGNSLIDYYLWVKVPGESDGTCNGGPAAGVWWPSYAEGLALNAGW